MDGLRGYYTKRTKLDRKRQIPYDFTDIQNLKNKINKHKRNKLIDNENKLMIARWEAG